MPPPPGKAITLRIHTSDDALERTIADGLAEKGLENDVRRVRPGMPGTSAIDETADTPTLTLIDMRHPNDEARAYLRTAKPESTDESSIVVLIADRDDETSGLEEYARVIAGRVSSDTPIHDLIRLIDDVFAENWTIEDIRES